MKRVSLQAFLVGSAVGLVLSCGTKPPPEPENPDRDLPGMGTLSKVDAGKYTGDPFDASGDFSVDGGCCMVRFAISARDSELSMTLKGEDPPLEGAGIALTKAQGVWSGSACLPADWHSAYYYEATQPSEDPEHPYVDTRVNPHVETTAGGLVSQVNLFSFNGATCSDFDGGVHVDTSALSTLDDAGVTDAGSFIDSGMPDAGGMIDAGIVDAGGAVDAGPLVVPVKTVIAGACDTLSAPTVLLDGSTTDLDEENTPVAALPFAFSFFGQPMTHFAASSNGYVMLFPSASGSFTQTSNNASIPDALAPNGFIAPLWDDLASVTTTRFQSQLFGTGSTRHVTWEWRDFTFFLGSTERATFQVKLFETTNAIEIHYCTLAANGGGTQFEQGFGATVGIEAPGGTVGVQHSDNASVLTTTSALHFE